MPNAVIIIHLLIISEHGNLTLKALYTVHHTLLLKIVDLQYAHIHMCMCAYTYTFTPQKAAHMV